MNNFIWFTFHQLHVHSLYVREVFHCYFIVPMNNVHSSYNLNKYFRIKSQKCHLLSELAGLSDAFDVFHSEYVEPSSFCIVLSCGNHAWNILSNAIAGSFEVVDMAVRSKLVGHLEEEYCCSLTIAVGAATGAFVVEGDGYE